jgi:ribosomal protein S7
MSTLNDTARNQLDLGVQLIYKQQFEQAVQVLEQALNEPGPYEYYI